MVDLNNEIYHLKSELNVIKAVDPAETVTKGNDLEKKLHLRWTMIAGEGSVFIVLLFLGVLQVRNAFRREAALTQQQKNFLLSVTHELKSPVASIQLQLETLSKIGNENTKLRDELIGFAHADTARLNKLVENILLSAKIESKGYKLNPELLSISDLINGLSRSILANYGSKHKIIFNIEKEIQFLVDSIAFASIVLNLVENAVKYSPAGTEVTIILEKKADKILLAVKDEGLGILASEKQKVFDKFYRIGSEETRSTKGTGLGLYIVKHLVLLQNGTITVKDNSPKGSIFEITFSELKNGTSTR